MREGRLHHQRWPAKVKGSAMWSSLSLCLWKLKSFSFASGKAPNTSSRWGSGLVLDYNLCSRRNIHGDFWKGFPFNLPQVPRWSSWYERWKRMYVRIFVCIYLCDTVVHVYHIYILTCKRYRQILHVHANFQVWIRWWFCLRSFRSWCDACRRGR